MDFNLQKSLEILQRTPDTLFALLLNISSDWTTSNEGGDTCSVYDIIGHLIHGERTDWIPRIEIILSDKTDKTFTSFDRFAQFEESKGKTIAALLAEFKSLREKNIKHLQSLHLTKNDYKRNGVHPVFGEVTLEQLVATWTVHDLNHIAQITRVMAKQYKSATGPWIEYLPILKQ
ncbi:MAG: DinB family protein [Chitinophagales bacterium]